MSCGGHNAKGCEQCPGKDGGEEFCNGDCEWKDNKCGYVGNQFFQNLKCATWAATA